MSFDPILTLVRRNRRPWAPVVPDVIAAVPAPAAATAPAAAVGGGAALAAGSWQLNEVQISWTKGYLVE